ncbi:MAG: nucleotidyltransferase family protein [Chloroflexi bacterium]|nr:nucleotidyltransferase family protein [Chloroflexota bacterium]
MLLERAATITRPEHRLLLLLGRTHASDAVYREAQKLIDGGAVDWKFLIDLAQAHGVLSLLHRHLKVLRPAEIPPSLDSHMQTVVMYSTLLNLEMTREVLKLSDLMAAANIETLVYKGPALALLAYDGVGLRQFGDIDALVPAQKLRQAKELLLEQNYVAISSPEHRSIQKDDHDRSYQGYDMISPNGRIALDLQERFGLRYSSFDLGFEELWERRQKIPLAGRSVPTLSTEDYMLVLSAHGTQHRWALLKWVCDIAELVRRSPNLDWGRVLKRAEAMQIERMLHIGLLLAHELLDMPLADAIAHRVQSDTQAIAFMNSVVHWMFHEAVGLPMLLQRARFDYGFDLSVRPRLEDKIQCILFLTRRRLMRRVGRTPEPHATVVGPSPSQSDGLPPAPGG